uniref:DUF397 domain-containing protein n=1 Tax=Steinernema glaseri TaxID=37863 RepID=A0A1I7ZRK7_9BILA
MTFSRSSSRDESRITCAAVAECGSILTVHKRTSTSSPKQRQETLLWEGRPLTGKVPRLLRSSSTSMLTIFSSM